jgi:hypothetical protein
MRTKAGFSCAHGAALNGHHDILRTLHEVGGSRALAERCNRGATCAYVAIEKGHIDTLQVISRHSSSNVNPTRKQTAGQQSRD